MVSAGGISAGGGVIVVMDPAPVVYLKIFHPESGPDRYLKRKAEAVAMLARVLCPVSSGRLKSTIRMDRNRDEKGRYAFGYAVTAETPYVMYVHEGTSPSPRWPDSRKVMHWHGREGDFPYRDFVMHPGTPSQPFLRDALVAMVA